MSKRYYSEIDKEEFIKKVESLIYKEDFPYELSATSQLGKDLSKVQFDWENYTTPGPHEQPYANYPFIGYKELAPGFHTYFMQAGGDWEFPICFIFYWGEGKLRAYIPTAGNAWNKKEKCAYGSDSESSDTDGDGYEKICQEVNGDLMINDILQRIQKKA